MKRLEIKLRIKLKIKRKNLRKGSLKTKLLLMPAELCKPLFTKLSPPTYYSNLEFNTFHIVIF